MAAIKLNSESIDIAALNLFQLQFLLLCLCIPLHTDPVQHPVEMQKLYSTKTIKVTLLSLKTFYPCEN
ncbi:hypothetical protein PF005_g26655 [Phytophthora fragariae]|uniref:RxLR effector protein n=1 Tax=Phytophthora fragariae TaxID=53985 RepID=A0A6A3QZR2_9STRA|nr:hypothetical protein PF003_g22507 [Phytophthora fragariae]KAE8922382.1 hypothetical protein PF009_g27356 [Phytophthora fragariae]KAE8973709.1 hypothetical protein PF011_g25142 [Phytophthora fragariae]KAE9071835.1 hypothetical protein PF010_g25715 [Phytophthora fragariae]KAE9071904.1 hypothetical protein PF007_g26372 [Phytophthora fragariae]